MSYLEEIIASDKADVVSIGNCAKVATITSAVYQGYHVLLDI